MQLILGLLDEAWRLLRLFAVGCTWAVPFLLVSFVNANPGVASHPQLAKAFEAVQWPLIAGAPLASLLGVALIAWLTRAERGGSLSTALVLLILPGVGAVIFSLRDLVSFEVATGALLVVSAVMVILGCAFTIATLARRAWWLSLTWLVLWSAATYVVWLASARTPENADDLGAGLLLVLAGTAVLAASAFGALVGFVGPRMAVNMRRQADAAASARTI